MEEKKYRSIYISASQDEKLERAASQRNVSPNRLVGMLIDALEEVEVPPVQVILPTTKKEKILSRYPGPIIYYVLQTRHKTLSLH